jgi:hypothetical protein
MPDLYYRCHNCGCIHETEAIRLNLHIEGHPLGDACFPRRSLLGWLERRRVTALIMRGLWPAGASGHSITGELWLPSDHGESGQGIQEGSRAGRLGRSGAEPAPFGGRRRYGRTGAGRGARNPIAREKRPSTRNDREGVHHVIPQ